MKTMLGIALEEVKKYMAAGKVVPIQLKNKLINRYKEAFIEIQSNLSLTNTEVLSRGIFAEVRIIIDNGFKTVKVDVEDPIKKEKETIEEIEEVKEIIEETIEEVEEIVEEISEVPESIESLVEEPVKPKKKGRGRPAKKK